MLSDYVGVAYVLNDVGPDVQVGIVRHSRDILTK